MMQVMLSLYVSCSSLFDACDLSCYLKSVQTIQSETIKIS